MNRERDPIETNVRHGVPAGPKLDIGLPGARELEREVLPERRRREVHATHRSLGQHLCARYCGYVDGDHRLDARCIGCSQANVNSMRTRWQGL
jgi:hypothetical protein